MKLQGIIFDLDGTLADTMEVCLQAFQETLQHFDGGKISLEELISLFGPSEEGILHRLLPDHGLDAYRYYLNCYKRCHASCTQPFPGVEMLLNELNPSGLRIAIATGKSAETAEISMRVLHLAPRVERGETGFIDRGDKPELIRCVVDGWGFLPEQTAYVRDVPTDLYVAEEVGVLPIGAAWAETSILRRVEQKEGWIVFERVEDLAAWVSKF